jgi:hypothetical protein
MEYVRPGTTVRASESALRSSEIPLFFSTIPVPIDEGVTTDEFLGAIESFSPAHC